MEIGGDHRLVVSSFVAEEHKCQATGFGTSMLLSQLGHLMAWPTWAVLALSFCPHQTQ